MYNDVYMDPSTGAGPSGYIAAFMWVALIAVYLYFAFMQYKMAANKTGNADMAWFAFIPILNTVLLIKMADKPMWWFLLLLVPIVNVIAFFILWMEAAKACSQSPAWGFLMLIPPLSFVAAFILAYGSRPVVYPDAPSETKRPQTPVGTG